MRIGVISDTHDNARNVLRIVELLREAGVARVVHTGDITRPDTLGVLARLELPIVGVYGNNDVEREGLGRAARHFGIELVEPPLELRWAGRRITVVHDRYAHGRLALCDRDVILHGHEHRHSLERSNGTLIWNPGECAGLVAGQNSVGVLDLAALEPERLRF